MRTKNNKKWTLVLVLLLVVSIGYAALASNLKINGTTGVKSATWDVYWNNVQIKQGSVATTEGQQARITDQAKTQVEYSVTLNEPGDFYEFTVDAVNNGSIDAMIAANGIVNGVYSDSNYTQTATLPDAVRYTVTYADGTEIQDKHLLAKKNGNTPTTETYKVRIEYRNDDSIDPEDLDNVNDLTYYFKFSVNYVQADDTKIARNGGSQFSSAITYVTRQNEGQITPGDVIKIGDTENFYVISTNSEKTVLLAKNNLLVGNELEDLSIAGSIATNTSGYGLQSDTATAYVSGDGTYKGSIDFSQEGYWDDGDGNLVSSYSVNGASYDGNLYPYIYDSNSTIYEYINGQNGYVNRLKAMGAPSMITGRLLTYEEADAAQSIEDSGTSIIFDGRQSYWLGSASNYSSVWGVYSSYSDFSNNAFADDYVFGVRPVIEIPTSELQ